MSFMNEVREQGCVLQKVTDYYFTGQSSESKELSEILVGKKFHRIIFTGMGSSLFATYTPCLYLRTKGMDAYSFEACELTTFAKELVDGQTLLIAVSQSGESPETLRAASYFREICTVVTVTNNSTGGLCSLGELNLPIFAGVEEASANKTYTNTLAVLFYIAYHITGAPQQEFVEACACLHNLGKRMTKDFSRLQGVLSSFAKRFITCSFIGVIGSGTSYCTACQGELLLIEAIQQPAAGFTTSQFLHGPMEIINQHFGGIMMDMQEPLRQETDQVIDQIKQFGGQVLVFTNRNMTENEQVHPIKMTCENPFLAPVEEIFLVELLLCEAGRQKNQMPGVLARTAK